MSLVQRILAGPSNDIQVSGLTDFPESRWREAILHYLFGVWSNADRVMYRPKIMFGDITLRLDKDTGEYYAYGHLETEQDGMPDPRPGNFWIAPSGQQAEVEMALIRFVKDNRLKILRLTLPASSGALLLWKKERRGEYGCKADGLPYSWGTKGPIRTREEYERGDWCK